MKLQYIAILIAGVSLGTGCKKGLLDLYPEGNIASGNFFRNTGDFQMAVVGAYVPLRNIADQAYYMDEMRADNTHYEFNAKDRGGAGFEQLGDFTDNAQNGVTGARYNHAYSGIHRCNTILDRLEKIKFSMDEKDKKQITGEAKALRAHYYFDLVRHFGKVPLPLHELLSTDPKQVFLPRTSVDSVYNQIVADFTDALSLLEAPEVPSSGRMNKAVVACELGLVYITRKQWDKAVPLLQSVTGMKYDLLPNYRDNFDPAKKGTNKEAIFEVQYKSGTDGQQSIYPYRFMPVTDSSKAMLDIEFNNQNGGWNTPTADLMRQYEADDKRMNASIGFFEGYVGSNGVFKVEKLVTEDARTYVTPPGKTSRVFIKKYYFYPYKIPAYNTDQNWPVFRLGGVLLLLAEALNENNQSSEALAPLNRVRQRAGLLTPISNTDQAQLRDIIAKEQRLELAFENYRWPDLVRTGKAAQVMTAHGLEMKSLYGYLSADAYNVTEKKYIYPIPAREMQQNPTWTQNDY
ncbi:RagB/SusD family nutrient uptake outer membrane protein [Pseudoflavitalea sp. G-6-1-2]|uniref:RagB/SusD family nutrient uptake outer membrane protein n=1 Tax=Pseudoflavitalea sp. G-6-1-2 TaxID=2728841 RepID=UPI00146A2A3C|nr:RagB/SusD family nutrient uptake outer membrane protein [Pseudoflavitalea sp. G-6-1-2]NML21743.1 RagB/SusD family nutrient uptake outer membrane protein [Pseudoflavitalea sp. G-6-1-2]